MELPGSDPVAIRAAGISRLTRAQQERFWLELNLRRADRQAVRPRIYKLAIERTLPALLVWLLGTAAALIAGIEGAWVGLGSVSALGAILAIGRSMVRRQPTNAATSSLVSPPDLSGLRDATSASLEGVADEVFPDPAYESKSGFLQFVQADIRNMLDLVATPRRPRVIFVDDLDRCSPGVVAQTIEAINLFLAGQFPNVVFLLAIEPAVVAAHVEVAHRKLLDRLKEDRLITSWSTLGWQFLENRPATAEHPAAQSAASRGLPLVALRDGPHPPTPPPDEATMERFVKRVVDDVGDAGLEAAPSRLQEVEATVIPDVSPEFAAEARRRAVAAVFEKSFKDSDPLVRRVIGDEARQLPARNAREIKRRPPLDHGDQMAVPEQTERGRRDPLGITAPE